MVKNLVAALLCLIVISASGQTGRSVIVAVYQGLNSYSSVHADASVFSNNQAALAEIKKSQLLFMVNRDLC